MKRLVFLFLFQTGAGGCQLSQKSDCSHDLCNGQKNGKTDDRAQQTKGKEYRFAIFSQICFFRF